MTETITLTLTVEQAYALFGFIHDPDSPGDANELEGAYEAIKGALAIGVVRD